MEENIKRGIIIANMIEDEEIRLEAINAILLTMLSSLGIDYQKSKYKIKIKKVNKVQDRDDRLTLMTAVISGLLVDLI